MEHTSYRVYPYRWVILAATMLVNFTIQTLWIAYSPITSAAAAYYSVSEMAVGFFAMSFMIAFVPFSIPASWLIDRFGYVWTVGAASVAVGIFGLLRGAAGHNYALAFAVTSGRVVSGARAGDGSGADYDCEHSGHGGRLGVDADAGRAHEHCAGAAGVRGGGECGRGGVCAGREREAEAAAG